MYGIAITVASCLQSGTRADVAWLVEADGLDIGDWSDTVVFTPGGGHVGALVGGALDAKLTEEAGRLSSGRVLDLEITQVDALIAGLPAGGRARCLMAPAETLPDEVWRLAGSRENFCLVVSLRDGEATSTEVYSAENIESADSEVGEIFREGKAGSTFLGDTLVSLFVPIPQLVVVGMGPIAEAIADQGRLLGWHTQLIADLTTVNGHIAPLSSLDKVVVAAHDLELAGAALTAALESDTGYIGSLGSRKMQADRADWLAYRGIEDLERVHGPAGLDIGANTPAEIAVAVVAEAIASARSG